MGLKEWFRRHHRGWVRFHVSVGWGRTRKEAYEDLCMRSRRDIENMEKRMRHDYGWD